MILSILRNHNRLFVLGLVLAVVAVTGWSVFHDPTVSAAQAGVPAARSLRGGAATYIISQKRNGAYVARLSTTSVFQYDAVLPAYRQANLTLARELIDVEAGEVPVQITFAGSLDLNTVRGLITEKGIKPRTILLLGTDGLGDKSSAGFNLTTFQSVDEAFLRVEERLQEMRAGIRSFTSGSVRVLAGSIAATPAQLGSLLDDPRVALVDVMEWDIRRDVRDALGIPTATQLDVFIPSPYWNLK